MKYALGLDLGTTSLSAVAVREDGSIAVALNRPNPAAIAGLPNGYAEQNPLAIRDTALDLLRDLAAQVDGSPCALGLTGQMHGGLLIDNKRNPLTNLITWQDRRSTIPDAAGRTTLEQFRAACPSEEIAKTGCTPSAGYLGVTLHALQAADAIHAKSNRAVLIVDWLAAELCDGRPVTDRSNAASTGLFNLQDDCWSEPLIQAVGIDAALLPDVRESGEIIGDLAPEIAARTGLPAGLPVCNAIGDNQAAVLGSVPAGESALQINIGTGGQINWPVSLFKAVAGMDTRYRPIGQYMLVGAGVSGGDSFAWVAKTVERWLTDFGVLRDREDIYETLNRLAENTPADADGLICEPFFRGLRRRPDARGLFSGIDVDNFTPGHVARAVLNGIAAGLHGFLETAGEHRPATITRIIGSGNGLRKNRLLVATIARTFQQDVWLPSHQEEAAYGTALLAGSQIGLWPTLEAAGQLIRLERAAY